ncbi:MAG: acyl-CoA oxidase, partial [Glaciecola sp.]
MELDDGEVGMARKTHPAVAIDPNTGWPTDAVADPIGPLTLVTADTQSRLWQYVRGPRSSVRDQARAFLRRDDFAPVHEMPRTEHRERIRQQLAALAGTDLIAIGFPAKVGGQGDAAAFVTFFEELSYGDVSLQVKVGVHFGLFGGAVQHLGTERHWEQYLPGVIDFSLPGCFAMTETGHGSDVQSIGTTATYDVARGEFDLHTPDRTAWKDYIGNAASHARVAVVFAQLVTPALPNGAEGTEGTATLNHGVHAFVVPLRGTTGEVLSGIKIEDNGHKLGLNGVDNGRISF